MEGKKFRFERKKLNKYEIAAIVIVCVLAVAFAIFLPLYLKSKEADRQLYKENKIAFYDGDTMIAKKSLDEMKALVETKTFQAVYKPSGKEPVTKTYKGFLLADVLTALGIDYTSKSGVAFICKDIEINKNISFIDNNTYIAFESNGAPIPDESLDGGENGGPFLIIPANEQFSQNRVKWLVAIKF